MDYHRMRGFLFPLCEPKYTIFILFLLITVYELSKGFNCFPIKLG